MMRVRSELRKAYREAHPEASFVDVHRAVNTVSDTDIQGVALDEAVKLGMKVPSAAFGDGHIIQIISDFFKSPQGQALMAALIKALLLMLGI